MASPGHTSAGGSVARERFGSPFAAALVALALAAATAWVWRGTLAIPFHLDDHHTVADNLEIRDLGNCGRFLRLFFARGVFKTGLAINYALAAKLPGGEPRPAAFHAVNLGIQLLNAVLAFLLVRAMLVRGPRAVSPAAAGLAAAGTAGVWAWSPHQAMAVNLIASRPETQAAGFVLAALFLAVLARDAHRSGRARLALGGSAALAAALAIGSKSVAVTVFPLWLLVTRFLGPPSPATRGEPVAAVGQGGAVSIRAAFTGCLVAGCAGAALLLSGEVWQSRYHGAWANLCTQAPVVLRYARLMVAPHRVSLIHDVPIRTGLDAVALLSMLALAAALTGGAWLAHRRDWLGCGLLWDLIAIAPSSSLIPRGEPLLEYRSYLATLGLAGALVYGVVRVGSWSAARLQAEPLRFWVPAGALVGWMIVLAAHTTAVNRAYGDALALWSRAARLAPGSYRAHHGYGRALYGAGRYAEAAEHYRRSIALEPGFPNNYWNLAAALAAQNDLAEAERELRRGLAVAPSHPNALVNLGVIRRRLNDPGGAMASFERALAVEPAHAEGNYNLADLLCEGGAFAAAARHYEAALRVRPSYAKALAGLATARVGMGDPTEATRLAERALAVDPNEATAHAALADAWAASNRHAEALATLERGLTRSPGHRLLTRKKGWLLAASPVPEQRDPAAAGRLAAMLVHASGGTDARELDLLAAAHAAAGRFDAAALTARRALGLLRRPEDEHLIRQITQRLQLYESRRPYLHPPTPPDSKTDEKKVAAEPIEKVQ